MTELKIIIEDNLYKIEFEELYFEFSTGSADNRKALILFLRGFKKRKGTNHGLFTLEQIARRYQILKGHQNKACKIMSKDSLKVGIIFGIT